MNTNENHCVDSERHESLSSSGRRLGRVAGPRNRRAGMRLPESPAVFNCRAYAEEYFRAWLEEDRRIRHEQPLDKKDAG